MSGSPSDVVRKAWSDIALDSRLVEAIKKLKWKAPTPVQSACIPLAMKGRDLAIQSQTGTGKTGAFLIPVIQRIITENERACGRRNAQNPVALILLPSEELCKQTVEVANALTRYVKPRIIVNDLTSRVSTANALRLTAAPILVSTAASLGKLCRNGSVTSDDMKPLRCVVIDEADLIMSIAEGSLRAVQSVLPTSAQTILASATLTDGVAQIKGQLLHNPITVSLKPDDGEKEPTGCEGPVGAEDVVLESRVTVRGGAAAAGTLRHYYLVSTDECHHHTLLYALYRLGHIKGKTLVFVNSEDTTYKLHNFLAQLGINALVYDSNLPMNVRVDALRRFQTGKVGTLVCTDGTLESLDRMRGATDGDEETTTSTPRSNSRGKRKSLAAGGDEGGSALHRGIDFSDVSNVILFDGVTNATTSDFSRYTHRVGRAGRGNKDGVAITFLTLHQARKVKQQLRDYLGGTFQSFAPFKQLDRHAASRLQYRVDNVLASITRSSTRRQRVAAVAAELTRSAHLMSHMGDKDSGVLKRILSRSKGDTKCDQTVVDVPEYMRIKGADSAESYRRRVRAPKKHTTAVAKRSAPKRSRDPLGSLTSSLKRRKL
ncbi:ATP-dependent DEAD/H RNA helicase, putative [Trypanosoma brucei gambiense DAL972]|uniref:ATP-dependent DEAD/H RNA helicase, putative n=1 Tax=Trypanosoma brucei gambiense (strain MHOM/CI/86/DAL972) TaxID=679716 RepID=D0A6Z3_TRYB9|nr:ATP-dependent DEAD/H RNA helicase, putative [Trypanosoma brucei gambiense DAL972]CBH17444.1 ATP-dependent DEAD/H RNA helicase, putative [Trypanosoma brucei gambiense DAL972]|eukprot:XP_011779708.1 ATP-dependent DEAD/H RNA helicase, putative [Trypanosoma brucei gambiense DAL972]